MAATQASSCGTHQMPMTCAITSTAPNCPRSSRQACARKRTCQKRTLPPWRLGLRHATRLRRSPAPTAASRTEPACRKLSLGPPPRREPADANAFSFTTPSRPSGLAPSLHRPQPPHPLSWSTSRRLKLSCSPTAPPPSATWGAHRERKCPTATFPRTRTASLVASSATAMQGKPGRDLWSGGG
jgi:hypothetical protein